MSKRTSLAISICLSFITACATTSNGVQEFGSVTLSRPTRGEADRLSHFLWTPNPETGLADDEEMNCVPTGGRGLESRESSFLCSLDKDVAFILGPVLCVDTEAELKRDLQLFRFTMLVNGQTVPEQLFLSYGEKHERSYKGHCNIWRTKFSSWRPERETTVTMVETHANHDMDYSKEPFFTLTNNFRVVTSSPNNALQGTSLSPPCGSSDTLACKARSAFPERKR